MGATYTDNIIRAWGEIDASGIILASFGISGPSITWIGNMATVWLDNAVKPDGFAFALGNTSVTATIESSSANSDPGCVTIAVSPIQRALHNALYTDYFTVWTHTLNSGTCTQTPLAFTFKVCGR